MPLCTSTRRTRALSLSPTATSNRGQVRTPHYKVLLMHCWRHRNAEICSTLHKAFLLWFPRELESACINFPFPVPYCSCWYLSG